MEAPANFKIELFVIRGRLGRVYDVGLRRCASGSQILLDVVGFKFEARPVVAVMDAVRVEQEAIAFRDGLSG